MGMVTRRDGNMTHADEVDTETAPRLKTGFAESHGDGVGMEGCPIESKDVRFGVEMRPGERTGVLWAQRDVGIKTWPMAV